MTTTTATLPAGTTNPPPSHDPLLVVLAAVLLLAVTAGSFWAYQRSDRGPRSTTGCIGYEVRQRQLGDGHASRYARPAGAAVLCRVEALGDDGGAVGSGDVRLGRGC